MADPEKLAPYPCSLAGTLLAAREAVMTPIRPILRAAGVTDQQWRVMRVLADAGPLDAGAIAAMALLYPPSVTRIVRELSDRGLLSRTTDGADRRRSIVSISPEGGALVRATAGQTARLLKEYEDAFGAERLTRFIAEAGELTQALARFAPPNGGVAASDG